MFEGEMENEGTSRNEDEKQVDIASDEHVGNGHDDEEDRNFSFVAEYEWTAV